MAYRNKYQLMKQSEVTDKNGNPYPELATFPIENIKLTKKPIDYKLTYNDTQRFDLLTYKYYGDFNLYDDINLWINNIDLISDNDENFGKEIKLLSQDDIDNWYLENIQ